jgi:hypothetical protein
LAGTANFAENAPHGRNATIISVRRKDRSIAIECR